MLYNRHGQVRELDGCGVQGLLSALLQTGPARLGLHPRARYVYVFVFVLIKKPLYIYIKDDKILTYLVAMYNNVLM